ncbi:MAG: C-GCAxxG-C-C family (seleno)protein [Candidatus Hydrogenedentota bacterium]
MDSSSTNNTPNRRTFLRHSLLGAGAVAGMAGAGAVASNTSQAPELPWPYKPLDLVTVRKRTHLNYGSMHCAEGVFTTLVDCLAETVGAPYDTVPTAMMRYANSGVVGFGSLCGALNGAGAAMSLACPGSTVKELLTELISWYASTPLPSEISNAYATEHDYLDGDNYSIDIALPPSLARGNLCHMSVSNWCSVSGFASGSKERAERCARLSADVAAKAAELMNAWHAGHFRTVTPLPADGQNCRRCHSKSHDSYTRGKMDCTVCHTDPTRPSHANHANIEHD